MTKFTYQLVVFLSIIFCFPSFASTKKMQCTDYVDQEMCVKIGQMLIVGFGGMNMDEAGKITFDDQHNVRFSADSNIARAIRDCYVGNVILYAKPIYDPTKERRIRERNVQGPKQLAKLNRDLKHYSDTLRAKQRLPKVPFFIAIDQEGGMIDRLRTEFGFRLPRIIPMALGCKQRLAGDDTTAKKAALSETRRYAGAIAKILHQENIDIDFAPVVDVNLNPTNPVIGALGRSFSDDPNIVADQTKAMVEGLHQQKIIAVLKHFPGHGSSSADSHIGFTDVTDDYQRAIELLPYQRLFAGGYHDMVMTAHVVNGQLDRTQCKKGRRNNRATWCPGTLSKKTLTHLLRNQLGFRGVIVSDDMTMGAIAKEYSLAEALTLAINAGVDMFIIANHQGDHTQEVVLSIAKAIEDGRITKERIDDAYERIVIMKRSVHDKTATNGIKLF